MTGWPSDRVAPGYRADIDGLRAIAVLAVVLYHVGVPWLPGGFFGVDVFFVISGFVITALLRAQFAAGTFSLTQFYVRRIRRIVPALLVVLAASGAAAWILLPPPDIVKFGRGAAAAALFVFNIYMITARGGYFSGAAQGDPIQHTWSLSVEAQFYFLFPILLFACRQWPCWRQALLLSGLGALSAGGAFALASYSPNSAFYFGGARAWELLLGALPALYNASSARRRWLEAAGLAGLALIAFGLLSTPGIDSVQGALAPCVGTALVIWCGSRADVGVIRLLSLKPLVGVGLISYSLYLWHWPLLTIPAAAVVGGLELPARLGLVALAVVVAAASQRWVEEPIRRWRLTKSVRRTLSLAGATSVTVALVSVAMGSAIGASLPGGRGGGVATANLPPITLASPVTRTGSAWPSKAPPVGPTAPPILTAPVPAHLLPPLSDARDWPILYNNGCHLEALQVDLPECVFGDPDSPTTVVLYGDSHAAMWFPALERIAIKAHWRLISLTKSGCTPVDVGLWFGDYNRPYTECDTFRERVVSRIGQEHASLIVVSSAHLYQFLDGDQLVTIGQRPDLWDAGVARTVESLSGIAGKVAFLGDAPNSQFDVPSCVSAHLDDSLQCSTPKALAIKDKQTQREATIVRGAGDSFVDPTGWVCPGDPCPAIIGRYLVYRDNNHLTTVFAASLAQRLYDALPAAG